MRKLTFPENFNWGTSSNAIQVEGESAINRGRTLWDKPEYMDSRALSTPKLGSGHLKRYKEDIKLLKKIGVHHYRLSLSWSRIFPEGIGQANLEALDMYHRLIDCLIKEKIRPWITLYAHDMPEPLQKQGGWLFRDTALYFADFAAHMAASFSDRVSNWITLGDPFTELNYGYRLGTMAPAYFETDQLFVAAHNMLMAHTYALSAIRDIRSNLMCGISVSLNPPKKTGFLPSRINRIAWDYLIHLFLDPVFLGRYPTRLESRIFQQNKSNLQPRDLEQISEKVDFINILHRGFTHIKRSIFANYLHYQEISPKSSSLQQTDPLRIEPESLSLLLKHMKKRYNNPLQYISLNCPLPPAHESGLTDHVRIFFYRQYLEALHKNISEGSNIGGFFAHPFLDGFEFDKNDTLRSGIVHVDFSTCERKLKSSGTWYSGVCKNNGFKL